MSLPSDHAERKRVPIATGVVDYFPDALAEVARCSLIANEQHHPGETLWWDKSKSTDEADALMRHLVDRGKIDSDGIRHTAKVAWRGLALLQRELDAETMQRDYELPQRLVKKYELNTGRWDGEYVRYCVCGLNITNPDFTCFNEHCRAQ